MRLALEGDFAVLLVHDAGAAIPAQILRQIFEPLSPTPAGQSPWAQGVALRLHVAQQIAHSHGGGLSVESSRESGTLMKRSTLNFRLKKLGITRAAAAFSSEG